MALHILADSQNVVGWWLVLNSMQTPPTHYSLESSGQEVYIGEIHVGQLPTNPPISNGNKDKLAQMYMDFGEVGFVCAN